MEFDQLIIIRGPNQKHVATDDLIDVLNGCGVTGELVTGYPVMPSADNGYAMDALLVSPDLGILCFDIIEGRDTNDYVARQDRNFNLLSSRLYKHSNLILDRALRPKLESISFGPRLRPGALDDGLLFNVDGLLQWIVDQLAEVSRDDRDIELYHETLAAVQNITTIRTSGRRREPKLAESRGAKLRNLEDSIANLDHRQNQAVIETVEGIQRIRGLAGSGKTVVLALKASYLHALHPEWQIAVTFSTRSLKEQYRRFINQFSIESIGQEPDWDNLHVLNAWGAPGTRERSGIYYRFCLENGVEYQDFRSARSRYAYDDAFEGVVQEALDAVDAPKEQYDAILIDEAQDLPSAFLRLCFSILREPGHLVYAYDELQNLTGDGLPPPDELFGVELDAPVLGDAAGVNGAYSRHDITLQKCYRNSRPILTAAHALGFGIYRNRPDDTTTGLVQMFDQPSLWSDIGYNLKEGQLVADNSVILERTAETSPSFLEDHSPVEDILEVKVFSTERAQAEWVAEQIETNLATDELRYDDIMVINTDALTAREKLALVRRELTKRGIASHLAGVDTHPDNFREENSITCTGIHRAKGNEAAMVYIVNGNQCQSGAGNLAKIRNRLFTAITRSKAWVRVTGIGNSMQLLAHEFSRLSDANFELQFRYPTRAELEKMTIVHRDMSAREQAELRQHKQSLSRLVDDLASERLFPEDLDEVTLSRLRDLLGSKN